MRGRCGHSHRDHWPLRAAAWTGDRDANRPIAAGPDGDIHGKAAADEAPAEASAGRAGRPTPAESTEVGPVAAAVGRPAPGVAGGPDVAGGGIPDPGAIAVGIEA